MLLYQRIKECRIKQDLSQAELASLLGYKDRSSIAKIESGHVDLPQSKILAFAAALKTSPAYLMGLSEEPWHDDLLEDYYNSSDEIKAEIVKENGLDPRVKDDYDRVLRRLAVRDAASNTSSDNVFPLTDHELAVIAAYRAHPEVQTAVDRLLLLDTDTAIKLVARGKRVTQLEGDIDFDAVNKAISETPSET